MLMNKSLLNSLWMKIVTKDKRVYAKHIFVKDITWLSSTFLTKIPNWQVSAFFKWNIARLVYKVLQGLFFHNKLFTFFLKKT